MKTLNRITELRNIINISNDLDIDKHDLFCNLEKEVTDFEINEYRFVKEDEALQILVDSYESDTYMLGCFNAGFISSECDIDIDVVEALQEAEKFEVLGGLMLKYGIDGLIKEYIRFDGYGHAFGSYDHCSDEIDFFGENYIYFRI